MKILLEKHMSGKNEPHNMAFGADKPFVMKIACAIFPPSLRFAQAGLAAQKIVICMKKDKTDDKRKTYTIVFGPSI